MEKRRRKEKKSLRLGELGEGHWMRTAVDSNARRPDLPVGGKFNAQWKICVAFSNPIQSNRPQGHGLADAGIRRSVCSRPNAIHG